MSKKASKRFSTPEDLLTDGVYIGGVRLSPSEEVDGVKLVRYVSKKHLEETANRLQSHSPNNNGKHVGFKTENRRHTMTICPPVQVEETLSEVGSYASNDAPVIRYESQELGLDHEERPASNATCQNNGVLQQSCFVVVAIDFGTTYSGYAFSFARDPENIHVMRKWEGGDPGIHNQKTPTVLLLTPTEEFHSMGFTARDFYHDLDPREARRWLYFNQFKMMLHHEQNLSRETQILAQNGASLPAMTVFSHALRFFRDHAIREISDHIATPILEEDIRWVVTVPAIWRPQAKQFMREAAYQAGIASEENRDRLIIALEPEAASLYCRTLRVGQLQPEKPPELHLVPPKDQSTAPVLKPWSTDHARPRSEHLQMLPAMESRPGTRYLVVDCGGGTVDITVHEIADAQGSLRELHRASGGSCGSVEVDLAFEKLLGDIFGSDFIAHFKLHRPAAFVDLLVAFEARKRSASPFRCTPLNVALPFAFIDAYRKYKGREIEWAIRKYAHPHIRWSSQGMLRLDQVVMKELFRPTLQAILSHVSQVLKKFEDNEIQYLFLVGGFAESPLLQYEIREVFSRQLHIVIPQGVSLAILKGAVLHGMDPSAITVRRTRLTYGVAVLQPFIQGQHPPDKLVVQDGRQWCTDAFDKFVVTDQAISRGDTIIRSYAPARRNQKHIILRIYCTESEDSEFVTDPSMEECALLRLGLGNWKGSRPEIRTAMEFGDTEIRVSALEVNSNTVVQAKIDFLST